tara:strand:+ start:2605 stop:4167 length:1563 start_codon:yes stop_codon:yes gene_type:complete
MNSHSNKDKIIIIDFGSQVTKLIARRIREMGVFSEILTLKEFEMRSLDNKVKGVVLSGGPATVTKKNYPKISQKVFSLNLPILGICYGLQLVALNFKGKVKQSTKQREFGKSILVKKNNSILTKNFFTKSKQIVWMSHQDSVYKIPKGFIKVASTNNSSLSIIENKKKKIYGIQFHPEVTHTKNGKIILKNFVFDICGAKRKWKVSSEKKRIIENIRRTVKNNKVICALSGGVDSSVVALLMHKAIKKNLKCIMVDTGLMRKNEFKYTYQIFKNRYGLNIKLIDASNTYFKKLKNVTDPEKKRKVIGNLFIKIFEKEAKKVKGVKFLAQGTLYPDVIESRSATGSKTSKIKSHHNVGGLPKKMKLKLVEPLKELFKDEVRKLGDSIGLTKKISRKHPFPGPGLAIRIIGKVSPEKVKILQEADHIFINELTKNNMYNKIWQAYAALLPIKTVGVMGDSRTYENICLIRAITSEDGMTADYFNFPRGFLSDISNKIINSVKGINRVVYDITSKPPSTIELE